MKNQNRRIRRLIRIREVLEKGVPEVEHVEIPRFLVWGSPEFKYPPYIEVWVDNNFLDQEGKDLRAYSQPIVSEAEKMLNNPVQEIRRQGEILAYGMSGIMVRKDSHIYNPAGIYDNIAYAIRVPVTDEVRYRQGALGAGGMEKLNPNWPIIGVIVFCLVVWMSTIALVVW